MVLDVTGKKIIFLIDKGAAKSVLISHTGPVSSKSCTVTGVDRSSHIGFFLLGFSLASLGTVFELIWLLLSLAVTHHWVDLLGSPGPYYS